MFAQPLTEFKVGSSTTSPASVRYLLQAPVHWDPVPCCAEFKHCLHLQDVFTRGCYMYSLCSLRLGAIEAAFLVLFR